MWKNDPDNKLTGPDHVWFVAKKREENIYAISVAATATIYNHVVNNAGVTQVVDFKGWPAGQRPIPTSSSLSKDSKPYIAYGTAQGVHTLLSLPDHYGANQTLPEFLKTARRSAPQFIFTGFSLGGALSPTLALRLVNIGVFTDNDNVLTYPIAGASPGNAHFADSFADKFPKKTTNGDSAYQVWNGNVANSLDVVPNGWSAVTDTKQPLRLQRIPTEIYGNNPIPSVSWKIGRAVDAANKSGIIYMPLQSTLFNGPKPTPPSNEDEFIAIARKQHSEAYLEYFGVKLPQRTHHLSSQEAEVASVKVGASWAVDAEEENLFPDVVLGI